MRTALTRSPETSKPAHFALYDVSAARRHVARQALDEATRIHGVSLVVDVHRLYVAIGDVGLEFAQLPPFRISMEAPYRVT